MGYGIFRTHVSGIAAAALLLSLPLAARAERDGNGMPWRLPEPPSVSNAQSMETAFISLPTACRMAVQRELVSRKLARLPADGAWRNEVAEGMARYVAAFPPMGYGWHSTDGAMGLYWHVAFQDSSCPTPSTPSQR